jgi:acid stress-induced BolA-like protein IbaG/YrbA
MPTADELKQRIEAAIPGARADVRGADGQHFDATVVAPEFAGMSRLEQHRRVMAVFGTELGGRIHALALSTRPE